MKSTSLLILLCLLLCSCANSTQDKGLPKSFTLNLHYDDASKPFIIHTIEPTEIFELSRKDVSPGIYPVKFDFSDPTVIGISYTINNASSNGLFKTMPEIKEITFINDSDKINQGSLMISAITKDKETINFFFSNK